MTGSNTTPGAVRDTRIPTDQQNILMGPLSRLIGVAADFPMPSDGIKAVWRNETGPAA